MIIVLYNLPHRHIGRRPHIVHLLHYHNLQLQILSYHTLLLLLLLNSLSYDYFVISIFVSIVFISCPSVVIFILTNIFNHVRFFISASMILTNILALFIIGTFLGIPRVLMVRSLGYGVYLRWLMLRI